MLLITTETLSFFIGGIGTMAPFMIYFGNAGSAIKKEIAKSNLEKVQKELEIVKLINESTTTLTKLINDNSNLQNNSYNKLSLLLEKTSTTLDTFMFSQKEINREQHEHNQKVERDLQNLNSRIPLKRERVTNKS